MYRWYFEFVNLFLFGEIEMEKQYAIAYDIGTTGVKTCIFELAENLKLVAAASEGYKLYVFQDGGAEQDPNEWWSALCSTTKKVLEKLEEKYLRSARKCVIIFFVLLLRGEKGMGKIGFDNQKYLTMQSEQIRRRIEFFGGKLYLEFGGKLFDDFHASRVLPGFEPDSKIKMLSQLKEHVEMLIAINSNTGSEYEIIETEYCRSDKAYRDIISFLHKRGIKDMHSVISMDNEKKLAMMQDIKAHTSASYTQIRKFLHIQPLKRQTKPIK